MEWEGLKASPTPGGKWKHSLNVNSPTDKIFVTNATDRPFLAAGGDDLLFNQNHDRQVFAEASVKI